MELHDRVGVVLGQKGREVWFVHPDATVYDAIALMAEKDIGALLVIAEGELVGVISERDYARKVVLEGKTPWALPVREIMSTSVTFVSPCHTIGECMSIMTDQRVRHLPVVEEGRVVGILSIGDLVKWIISAQQETIHQLQSYITGKYPG